jgi:hypothetical protein
MLGCGGQRHEGELEMELHDLVRHEWADDHRLSRRSLIWIEEHADPGDPHPVLTAIAQLRAERDRYL